MKTLIIATAATLTLAAAAAPVLSHPATAEAKICASADTKAAWKAGNPSPEIVQADTVAGQKAYCAGQKTAHGHNDGATVARDNQGAVGAPSGTTGTQTPDVANTDEAAGMTTTMEKPAKPGD
jgi:hypothetical protein